MVVLDHNDTLYNSTISKSDDISDGIEIWTYIMIALSCFALGFNFWMFVHIKKNFPSTATYKIQRIDCLVTSLSQIGMIGHFLGSMDKHHDKLMCTIAACFCIVAVLQPIVSCLFLSASDEVSRASTSLYYSFPIRSN